MTSERTRKMITIAMLTAIAYILAFTTSVVRISLVPAVGFLSYDPKDIILMIAGFIFGPLAPLAMAFTCAFLEMITVSSTGIIGATMNFISSCAFTVTASIIYKKKRTIAGAAIGLFSGIVILTAVMMLWNYYLTPIFMGVPRRVVVALLIPGFLPFNLIKGTLNAGITLFIYKPIRVALDKSRLIPTTSDGLDASGKTNTIVLIISLFIIISCILFVLSIRGII